jgi:NAD(P)-dependent dehydrogenase (short-subunit alcohol dehydrogenase family)
MRAGSSISTNRPAFPRWSNSVNIAGCVAFVTGANRGLGKAYVDALFAAGAAKVYGGARDVASLTDARVTPVKLDVTSAADIAACAAACSDVTLLINNAGAMLARPILAPDSDVAMRHEMDVNVFGLLNMARAFAPVLADNGGGAIANMLSVVSWFTSPYNATYCASKHAALAVSDALRIELRAQGTLVTSVYAGFIDTEMAAAFDVPKTSPQQVAEKTLAGLAAGIHHVRCDQRAEDTYRSSHDDPEKLEAAMQAAWDKR